MTYLLHYVIIALQLAYAAEMFKNLHYDLPTNRQEIDDQAAYIVFAFSVIALFIIGALIHLLVVLDAISGFVVFRGVIVLLQIVCALIISAEILVEWWNDRAGFAEFKMMVLVLVLVMNSSLMSELP
jgi:hypothetical protein